MSTERRMGTRLSDFRVLPLGDRAILLAWPAPSQVAAGRIAALAKALRELDELRLEDAVPAYESLGVYFRAPYDDFAIDALRRLIREMPEGELPEGRHVTIDVRYGGANGPDLAACAQRSGLSEEAFARRHASCHYEVAMIGFAPGFPYLAGLDERLAQPRHSTPRLRVPAGSVGIAGRQTGIYPVDSPGGWQLIGRTEERLFRPESDDPFLLSPGDRVTFRPAAVTASTASGAAATASESTGSAEGESVAEPLSALESIEELPTAGEPILTVLSAGIMTTVQDQGRAGWRAYGVSSSGAADPLALRVANALIGNPERAAGLEFTLTGGSYRVESDLLAALCGAEMEASIDGERLPLGRPIWLRRGATLRFARARSGGCRAYLAVAGGIAAPLALGSRSVDPRAGIGRPLAAGDWLAASETPLPRDIRRLAERLRLRADENGAAWEPAEWYAAPLSPAAPHAAPPVIRVLPGAEWDAFTAESQARLFRDNYTVSVSSNRMGLRLQGEPLTLAAPPLELASHGVAPGTIQVPPDGQPIVLGVDCQPTGGYPKFAHVISADLPKLAQAAPGTKLRFERVDEETARRLWIQQEREMAIIKAGIRARLLQ